MTSICWWTNNWSSCVRYSRPCGTPGMAGGGAIHWTGAGWPGRGWPETQIE